MGDVRERTGTNTRDKTTRDNKKQEPKYSCKQQLPGPSTIRRQDMPTLLKVSDHCNNEQLKTFKDNCRQNG